MIKNLFISRFPQINLEALNCYLKHIEHCIENNEGYKEKHHILPKCLFPEYRLAKWNITKISASDHFIAHFLLWKLNISASLAQAWHLMSNRKSVEGLIKLNAEDYAKAKEEWRALASSRQKLAPKRLGWHQSEETKKKISEGNTGKVFPKDISKRYSEERLGKPSGQLGIKRSEETCKKISMSKKGRPSPNKGKKMSEEQKEKISKTRKEKNNRKD